MARALSAMCLLVIFVVVAYNVLVIRPFDQRTLVPTTQYLRADPTEIFFLTKWPWIVKVVGILIQMSGDLHHLIC